MRYEHRNLRTSDRDANGWPTSKPGSSGKLMGKR